MGNKLPTERWIGAESQAEGQKSSLCVSDIAVLVNTYLHKQVTHTKVSHS